MKPSKYTIQLLLVFALLFFSCKHKETAIPDESYVAFSLREAQQLIKQNDSPSDSSVYNLAGITRIVGMVIDRKNNDIILIGKKSSQLPAARFDDFVTALRARFVYDELPMVSIDPTPNSLKTGKQEVRFGGHIDETSFGHDFLESDILLKKYSLELAQQVQDVTSYKKLLLTNEINNLNQGGIKATDIKWLPESALEKIIKGQSQSGSSTLARFWYNYKDPYTVRIRGNVFCIMSLDIMVENEIKADSALQKNDSSVPSKNSPGLQFSNLFTNNFYKISNTHPIIKRLKLLFDMTAVAEGLKNTKDIPDISFLLKDYPVRKINNRKDFEFIKMCAVISRDDGKINLVQLNGGVQPTIDLQWLNAGDVSYLERFALGSRPDSTSLFWKIPIDNWDMPNSNGIITKKHVAIGSNDAGCSFYNNNYLISKPNDIKSIKDITENMHFASAYDFGTGYNLDEQRIMAPIATKGVQMRMKIDTSSFRHIDSLKKIREMILNN